MPGYQFMGPGTNIVARIYNGVRPINYNDAVTMIHDIDYLSSKSLDQSDDEAIGRLQNNIVGIVAKIGLTMRKVLGLNMGAPHYIEPVIRSYIRRDPKYALLFKAYNIEI